jgi:hypothetical protein
VSGCPNQYPLQWTNIPKPYTHLWLYAALVPLEDGFKYRPKHVELRIKKNKEYIEKYI